MNSTIATQSSGMYEKMLNLPLFHGVSRGKLSEILSFVKLRFEKYADREILIHAGDVCDNVTFILNGRVRSSIATRDQRLVVSQTLSAPDVISPDFLFGRTTLFPAHVVSQGETSIVSISKKDYMKVLASDEVFLFNLLNRLSKDAQKNIEGLLSLSGGSIAQRLAYWVIALTDPTGTDIVMQGRQRELYTMFGVARSSFMSALDELVGQKVLTYCPGRIDILDRPALAAILDR